MRIPLRCLLPAVAVLAAAPASASAAATASVAAGTLSVAGDAAADAVTVSMAGPSFLVTGATAGAGCTSLGAAVTCSANGVTAVQLTGAGGDDDLTVQTDLAVPTTLDGGPGADQLTGGAGAETLDGGLGDDALDGGGGTDTVRYRRPATSFVSVALPEGTATTDFNGESTFDDATGESTTEEDSLTGIEGFDGGDESDFVAGTTGANVLTGGAGDDGFDPGRGNDPVTGGAGDDTMDADRVALTDGDDSFDGGPDGANGGDTVRYLDRDRVVTVTLPEPGATTAVSGSGTEKDTLKDVENASGGAAADTLTGSSRANRLEGGEGADTLLGGDGADQLVGGDGIDTLTAGAGDDVVDARAGDAETAISCGDGADHLIADNGVDVRPADCERLAPAFAAQPTLSGKPAAGTALGLANTATTGDPATLAYTWVVCAPVTFDCPTVATTPTYTPTAAQVGSDLFVIVDAADDTGFVGDSRVVDAGTIGAAAPVVPVVTPPAAAPAPPPTTRPVADPLAAARGLLGAKASMLTSPSFAPVATAFTSPAARTGTLALGKKGPRVLAFSCLVAACQVESQPTLSTTAKKGGKAKKAKLKPQRIAIVGDQVLALSVRLTAAQRGRVHRSRKASVTLRIKVTGSDKRVVTRSVTYKLKA